MDLIPDRRHTFVFRALAHAALSLALLYFSPKNGKPAFSPRHDWLNTGSLLQNVPLRIWFYPQ
ncbi:serine/threonine protein kinase [Escherichia albertii]|nr:hypothetical protein [Escherichia albertii]MCU7297288.1 serine/threonine protein kinase [Escherichia albertii]MCU7306615.1 serine/threonine protein kinase [Escherichia albertii]MCZ8858849.1 serine/threonine protein kinase [Escherichia albertii]MCZ8925602.1 serine/threonine protein kinase [Escherichia albertii]MCZ9155008.1 serine/threonine protein kinase [Escherichia albertii]